MHDWLFIGINAPWFIWVASASLALFAFSQIIRLFLEVRRKFTFLDRLAREVRNLRQKAHPQGNRGLGDQTFDALRQLVGAHKNLLKPWDRFQAECLEIPDLGSSNRVSYFRTRPSGEAFSEQAIVDPLVNKSWFLAFPGVLTGMGLLTTFIAILLALKGLRVGSGETIEGIRPLITGLSGKFLSSIVALLFATIYTFAESPIFNKISQKRQAFCSELDELVPRRDAAQLVRDIAGDIREQTESFKNFGTSLHALMAKALAEGMKESMQPQQERMITALESLNTMMARAEVSKQESMTGELASLLKKLETSMTTTMNGMGERFNEALSGNATSQMEKVIRSMDQTASLLERMNAHSAENQTAMALLVQQAQDGSREQMDLGKQQLQDLSETLRNLMAQLQESAGTSVNQMGVTLTAVVHDLSQKVGTLTSEVALTMQKSSENATGAAQDVIQSAANWTARSEAQLQALVQRLSEDSNQAERMRALLDQSLGGFQQAIVHQTTTLQELKAVATQMGGATTAMGGAIARMETVEKGFLQVANMTRDQVASLDHSSQATRGMAEVMDRYTQVFAEAERTASHLLNTIGTEVQKITKVTQDHFSALVESTDNHLSNAVNKLGGSVQDLGTTIDALDDVLGKARALAPEPRMDQ